MATLSDKIELEISASGNVLRDMDRIIADLEKSAAQAQEVLNRAEPGSDLFGVRARAAQLTRDVAADMKRARAEIDRALATGSTGRAGSPIVQEVTRIDVAALQAARGIERLAQSTVSAFGPAGRAVGEVAGAFGSLGGGLDGLIAKAGMGSTALLGIGAATVGIYAVASALSDAADRAGALEANLIRAASFDPSRVLQNLERFKDEARGLSSETGFSGEESARLFSTAFRAFPDDGRRRALLLAAKEAALAKQGVASEIAAGLRDTIDRFKVPEDSIGELANAASVAAQHTRGDLLQLLQITNDTATDFEKLGVKARDAFTFIGAAALAGKPVDDAASGVKAILEAAADASTKQHGMLQRLGVDFAAAGKGGDGLLALIESINAAVERQPNRENLLAEIFGGSAQQQKVKAALAVTRQQFRDLRAEIAQRPTFNRDLAQALGNLPAEQLARTKNDFDLFLQGVGSSVKDALSSLAGTELKLPIDVLVPKDLDDAFRRAVEKGNQGILAPNDTDLEATQAAAANAGEAYGRAYSVARDRFIEQEYQKHLAQERSLRDPEGKGKRFFFEFDREAAAKRFDPGLQLAQFERVLRERASIVRELAVDPLAGAKPKPALLPIKPQVDPLVSDIDAALRAFDFTIGIEIGIPPTEVTEAVKRLQAIRDEASKQALPLQGAQAAEASGLTRIVSGFAQERSRLDDTLQQIVAQSLQGLDRQAAEFDRSEQALRSYVATLKLAPAELEKANAALERFHAANETKLDDASTRKAAEVAQKRLDLTTQSLAKARELALANGNVAQADALSLQIIEAQADARRRSTEAALFEIRAAAEGYEGLDQALDEISKRLREQVEFGRQLELLANQSAIAERDLAKIARLNSLQGETLTGLDAELAKIREIGIERRAALDRDVRHGSFAIDPATQEAVRRFYLEIEQRDQAIAERNAKLFQVDAIQRQLGELTDSYSAQAKAIDLARAAEAARLDESLRAAGVEKGLLEDMIALNLELGQVQKERLAIAFAQESAVSLVEKRLRDVAVANKTGQGAVDAASGAKNGPGAFAAGFSAGLTDATRSLNDFDLAVRASADLVFGFRDATSRALEGIGSKSGGDILKDFARENLENFRRIAAQDASAKLTRAIFGEGAANQLATADQRLALAGDKLGTAADALLGAAGSLRGTAFGANERAAGVIHGLVSTIPGEVLLPPAGLQGPGLDGQPIGSPAQQGPQPAGQEAGKKIEQSAGAFGSAVTSAAQVAGRSLIAGGQGAASFLTSFLGSLGNKASDFLTEAITSGITSGAGGAGAAAKFGAGGVLPGIGVRSSLSPKANRLGGIYSQRTFVEIAEVPGAQEAVIPMQGGKIPVELSGALPPPGISADHLRPPAAVERFMEFAARDQSGQRSPGGGSLGGSGSRAAFLEPPGLNAPARVQRVIDTTPARGGGGRGEARTVRVTHAPRVEIREGAFQVTIHAAGNSDPRAIADQVNRALSEQAPKVIAAALQSGSDRRLTDAVRSAMR